MKIGSVMRHWWAKIQASDSVDPLPRATILALFGLGIVLGAFSILLVIPHRARPLQAPLPTLQRSDVEAIYSLEAADAVQIRAILKEHGDKAFPAGVRAIAEAYRAWNLAARTGVALGSPEHKDLVREMRVSVREYVTSEPDGKARAHWLNELRAYHTLRFFSELGSLEHPQNKGDSNADKAAPAGSTELNELAGALIERLQTNHWMTESGRLLVPRWVVGVRFKLFWTSAVFGLADCERSAPQDCYGLNTLPVTEPELRAFLVFMLHHPVLETEGPDAKLRKQLVLFQRMIALDSSADSPLKPKPYTGSIDSHLAVGALFHQLGVVDRAKDEYKIFLQKHPEDLRAKNWLLDAIAASGISN